MKPHTHLTVQTGKNTEVFTYTTHYTKVVAHVISLLTIEIFPYWPGEQIALRWVSSNKQTDAALYGLAMAYRLLRDV